MKDTVCILVQNRDPPQGGGFAAREQSEMSAWSKRIDVLKNEEGVGSTYTYKKQVVCTPFKLLRTVDSVEAQQFPDHNMHESKI